MQSRGCVKLNYDQLFEDDFSSLQTEKVLGSEEAHLRRTAKAFSLVRDLRFQTALDIGCADGFFTNKLSKITDVVYGIDVSKTAIEHARINYPGPFFRVGNLIEIPHGDSLFDLVSCLDVIYYLGDMDRRMAVEEIVRVLKPNGHLLVSTSWPRRTKTRTGTSYMNDRELLQILSGHFMLLKEATTSTLLNLGFMRSGVVMLLRKEL